MEKNTKDMEFNEDLMQLKELLDEKYLTFNLGEEQFGINIKYVTEIIGIHSITTLPDVSRYIKGVINLRGKVHPVLDMRLRFDMDERDYDERTCIVVVNVENTRVGLIVDTVKEVIDIEDGNIDSPPAIMNSSAREFVKGLGRVNEDVIILLNTQKVLYDIDLEMVAQVEEAEA